MGSNRKGTTGKGLCCLLVTDAQHDFCEGSLAAPRGLQVAEKIGEMLRHLRRRNRTEGHGPMGDADTGACLAASETENGSCEELTTQAAVESISNALPEDRGAVWHEDSMDGWCDLVVFSLDWHPSDHVSFVTAHSRECVHNVCYCRGRGLSAAVQEASSAAVKAAMPSLGSDTKWTVVPKPSGSGAPGASLVCLWPPHCVQGTTGAKLHRTITPRIGDFVVRKGADCRVRITLLFCYNHCCPTYNRAFSYFAAQRLLIIGSSWHLVFVSAYYRRNAFLQAGLRTSQRGCCLC